MKNGLLFFFCLTFFACQKNEVLYPSSVNAFSSFDEFEKGEDELHYLIIVEKFAHNYDDKVQKDLRGFVEKKFSGKHNRISIMTIGLSQERLQLNLVRRFSNKKEVMDFYKTLKQQGKRFLPKGCQIFPITQQNYRRVLKNQSLNGYAEFFEANY